MIADGSGREYVRVAENRPIPKTVDWADAPNPVKLYRGCPTLRLDDPAVGDLGQRRLGRFLRDVYGLTRQRATAPNEVGRTTPSRRDGTANLAATTMLRPVPAGGARYPCELYLLAGPGQPVPPGVFHYDPAHHRLDVLRDQTPEAGLSLLITVAFWKNVFKYGEFSYRLHSLDAGVVLGQALAVAARHQLDPRVSFQFPDAELDGMLGLDPDHESVYAVISLLPAPAPGVRLASAGAEGLLGEPPSPHPKSIGMYPLPAKLHQVAMRQGCHPPSTGDGVLPVLADAPTSIRSVPLPSATLNLLSGLDRRRSAKGHFRPGMLSRDQLAALLVGSMAGYPNDLGGDESFIRHTLLCCAVHDVEGIDSGVYCYDPARHALEHVRAGDVRPELQAAVTSRSFNLLHVNLCFFPVARYESGFAAYGDRWYRVQNMEAGIIVQRLGLAAAALGLGCHTQLGFHVDRVNGLLGLGEGPLSSLVQVLIAPSREPGTSYDLGL